VFINFTNHPSDKWAPEQLAAAEPFGAIEDLAFPMVDPHSTHDEVKALAATWAEKIEQFSPSAVLCQGEFTLAYEVASILKSHNWLVLTACSERVSTEVQENGATKKISIFRFVSFREV
jgi:hypothetical protein